MEGEAARASKGGLAPQIVATQVVSDYLTSYDDNVLLLEAQGRPFAIYKYRMAFRRASTAV